MLRTESKDIRLAKQMLRLENCLHYETKLKIGLESILPSHPTHLRGSSGAWRTCGWVLAESDINMQVSSLKRLLLVGQREANCENLLKLQSKQTEGHEWIWMAGRTRQDSPSLSPVCISNEPPVEQTINFCPRVTSAGNNCNCILKELCTCN